MPTAAIHTFDSNKLIPYYVDADSKVVHFKLPNSTTLAAGTVVGELTASPGSAKAYASGNADGSQVPVGVLQYGVTVDASGNHTWGGSFWGETFTSAPVYVAGAFRTTDLVGLDATALTNGKWRLLHGTVADGVVAIPG